MRRKKSDTIDYSRERLAKLADKYYNEGKLFTALRFAYDELNTYGGSGDVYARLSDIYEAMGLHTPAINFWFRFLEIADEEDLPDIYEGLAVNYGNRGDEKQAAYYYNRLMDVDETLPEEAKIDIVSAFAKKKSDGFRVVYPPEEADYSKELAEGAQALKRGDCARAAAKFSEVQKGAKEYLAAKEMQSVAYLLSGKTEEAERLCLEVLQDVPNAERILSTLAAVYMEQGREEESKEIALRLSKLELTEPDAIFKAATVCCENGLHKEAYDKFVQVEKLMPYDGRMLYFKAVSALKSGLIEEAEKSFHTLCTLYPDSEVGKYYLRALKNREEEPLPEFTYFYHVPEQERESRCQSLVHMLECPKDEAKLFGLIALHDGYFRWCFDEMDGADHELQFLGLAAAVHVHADEFIREVMLDVEIADILKLETLKMLYDRNEDMQLGIVLYDIYHSLQILKINIGRKKRKRFIESYAKVASKFSVVNNDYGKRLKTASERFYRALEQNGGLELIQGVEDCACAIFFYSGIKEIPKKREEMAQIFGADIKRVNALLSAANGEPNTKENANEDEKA